MLCGDADDGGGEGGEGGIGGGRIKGKKNLLCNHDHMMRKNMYIYISI